MSTVPVITVHSATASPKAPSPEEVAGPQVDGDAQTKRATRRRRRSLRSRRRRRSSAGVRHEVSEETGYPRNCTGALSGIKCHAASPRSGNLVIGGEEHGLAEGVVDAPELVVYAPMVVMPKAPASSPFSTEATRGGHLLSFLSTCMSSIRSMNKTLGARQCSSPSWKSACRGETPPLAALAARGGSGGKGSMTGNYIVQGRNSYEAQAQPAAARQT
mmetsp:Transcript_66817/g.169441  ORF Transcript_66817/g.169441 Transcript_66817/m.169441 type:complete len:217 (-) Transcript_66817:7-657(-)